MYPKVILKNGRDKSIRNHHPWIFSGGIEKLPQAETGDIADVFSHDKKFLARGFLNIKSQIQVRLLTWSETQEINLEFWKGRVARAWEKRKEFLIHDTNCVRVIFGEADGFPGLIVDWYDGHLVLQSLAAGIDMHLENIIAALEEVIKPKSIYERSDEQVRTLEGVAQRTGWIKEPATSLDAIEINEAGVKFLVDFKQGHKTGFYLDQRDQRFYLRSQSKDKKILNCFSYTCGFGLNAQKGGASSVTNLDTSAPALENGKQNELLNGFSNAKYICGDAFEYLRMMKQSGEKFDVIVMDPPKFASNAKQVDKACRGYKDLNLLALQLLEPNGLLMTFSCSGLIDRDLFQKIIFGAAIDAGCDGHIERIFTQGRDHPMLLTFPEGLYLKGFAVRKI